MKKLFTAPYGWLAMILLLVLINLLASRFHSRIDLTREKRFTLSAPTKDLLSRLDEDVQVDLYLQGDLKAGIRKLSAGAQELLQEFSEYSNGRVRYRVVDPLSGLDDSAKMIMLDSLRRSGIQPKTQVAQSKKGEEQSQRVVIPGAMVHYKDKTYPVDLLKGVQVAGDGQPEEQLYSNAETLLEYKFGSAVDKIMRRQPPAIGYVLGNGEPLDFRVYDLIQDMRANYRFGVIRLDSIPVIPSDYDALIIVKPTQKFTDREKLSLDQYLMNGGQIIWAVDILHAEMDSLQADRETVAYDRGLDLEDLFFTYGVRVQPDLIEDIQSAPLNLVVGMQGNKPDMQLLSWPYFPLLNGSPTHPISKNLDPVLGRFVNSLDTAVKATGITKTVLLQTSDNARLTSTPAIITFESIKQASDPRMFSRSRIPAAVLMEGRFRSLFAGRIGTAIADSLDKVWHQPFQAQAKDAAAGDPSAKGSGSVNDPAGDKGLTEAGGTGSKREGSTGPTAEGDGSTGAQRRIRTPRVVVIGDADIVMNELTQRGPLPMGFNKDNEYTFANRDFIENCVEYMVNPSRILETRSKDFTLRLLDPAKVEESRSFWQFINIGLPILLVIAGGYIYQFLRKRKYQHAPGKK